MTIPLIDRRASQAGAIRMTTSVDVLIIGADASGAAPCPGALMTVARDELLETERERVTRQFEAGGSLGLSPAEKVERLSQLRRAKVYLSLTASRRKPPRSPASHNLLKPCPSLARWSGSRRRRNRAEPLPLPRRQERQAAPTELTGDRGPMVRIHLPPAVSRQTIGSSAAEPHLPAAGSASGCRCSLSAPAPALPPSPRGAW